MASQGPLAPTAAASLDWSNPTNVFADDAANASVSYSAGGASDWLAATAYGFTGVTAMIVGIEVELNGVVNIGDLATMLLTKDGTNPVGGAEIPLDGAGWLSYGGPTSLWATTWTKEEISASTFGVLVKASDSATGATATVDAVRITVYYTTIAVTPTYRDFPKHKLRSVT